MTKYYLTNDELIHWGIKGQKWGIRRFQNEDGSLTPEGEIRYGGGKKSHSRKEWKLVKKSMASRKKQLKDNYFEKHKDEAKKLAENRERKRQLYEKDVDKNSWLLDLDTDLANEMFETNTKRSKNAYEKAREAYDKYKQDGAEYIRKKMTKEFGKDFSDWNKEQDTQAAIAIGAAFAGAIAFYAIPLWLSHSDSDN